MLAENRRSEVGPSPTWQSRVGTAWVAPQDDCGAGWGRVGERQAGIQGRVCLSKDTEARNGQERCGAGSAG